MKEQKTKSKRAYTTFEAARSCHVSHHSIKNWIRQGLIRASRTPGGHYRILQEDLEAFRKRFDMMPGWEGEEKRRVMVVDDEPDALLLIQRVLEGENYEVITVSNPTEVGLLAAQRAPDLILLDFLMPEVNGFEVCRALKENSQTKDIPIIAVTCLTKSEDVEKIFSAGVNGYLAKPFKVDDLVKKVHEALPEVVPD